MADYPRISFGIIVLNGEPFTKYCLRALYPFAYEIVVVEGACQKAKCISTPDGHSRDGTLRSLYEFKEREDPENKLKIITRKGFWSEKDEQSQAYARVVTGDYLWQVDIDEFYIPEDMEFIAEMLKNIPEISAVSFELITFWGDICYRCNSTFPLLNPVEPIHRIFKFGEGYRYVSHRPPTVVDPNGIDLRTKKWVSGALMASKGIRYYHYSLLFPKQVQDKVTYYSNLPYEQCPLMPEWAKKNYHRISNPFNVFNVHTYPGWLERYSGKHPPQIYNMMNDIRNKKLDIKTRCNRDVEEFIDDPRYHRGIELIKQEYARKGNKPLKITDTLFSHQLFQELKNECTPVNKKMGSSRDIQRDTETQAQYLKQITPANKKQQPLSIVHINTHDVCGGAASVARRLAQAQRNNGHNSKMLVGEKASESIYSVAFPTMSNRKMSLYCRRHGQLFYEFQGSHELIKNELVQSADILHFHNLHGGYFNPFSISALSHLKPVVWSLHDMHSITGHCAHSFDCQKWQTGCGQCPRLDVQSGILVDTSAQLWRDNELISNHSHLHLVPSVLWLKNKVEKSYLRNHPIEVIYNGIDTTVFKPYNKKEIRSKFGILPDVLAIGAVAHGGTLKNPWKGGKYTQAALNILQDKLSNYVFINIGGKSDTDNPKIIDIPCIKDEAEVAQVYSMLDIFLYTPEADTCPLVVLEALSCGIPIATFATGGIPELVRNGLDGYVTEYKNIPEIVQAVETLAKNSQLRDKFSQNARQWAISKFDHKIVASQYENLYRQVIQKRKSDRVQIKSFPLSKVPKVILTEAFLEAENSKKTLPEAVEISQQGKKLLAGGDKDKALCAFRKALEIDPNVVSAYNIIGREYLKNGDSSAALKYFLKALKLDEYGRTAVLNCGKLLVDNGRIQDALRLYLIYLQKNPEDNEILQLFANLNSSEINNLANINNKFNIQQQQRPSLQHAGLNDNSQIQKNAGLAIATNIAPRNIDRQAKAIESWKKLGFNVVSINCAKEVKMLQQSFPDVKFVCAHRDGRDLFGKPVVYLDDFLEYFRQNDAELCGIVNSDIHLIGNESYISFLKEQAKNCLVYGSRVDVDSLDNLDGEFYEEGFDFFFFPKSLISCFPKSEFCIRMPWWDYWMASIPALQGIQTKNLVSPFAYHLRHPFNWSPEHHGILAKKFIYHLQDKIKKNFNANPNNNPWALLGRIILNYHRHYLERKDIDDEKKISVGIIAPCIIEFLKAKSSEICYDNSSLSTLQNTVDLPEKKENALIQSNATIRKDIGLTIATSIAPKNLEKQKRAVESWLKLGFNVVSINCAEEMELLQKSFPEVKLVPATRDGRDEFGKPVIYFDDLIEHLGRAGTEICGIVNSDIFLIADEGIISFIKNHAQKFLVYGSRTDIDSLGDLDGEIYERGFDFFFFHRSLLSYYPKSHLCIGLPWWDYWTPLIPALRGTKIKKLVSPFAYHIKHSMQWDSNQFDFLMDDCRKYLAKSIKQNLIANPGDSSWALLRKILSANTTQNIEQNCAELGLSADGFCDAILEFLQKKTLQITYSSNKLPTSQNAFAVSGEKKDIFIHKNQPEISYSDGLHATYDISAIVCTRDKAELLDRMLTSLKKATAGITCEVIVVEGGSSDNTLDILRKHHVKKIYCESEWLGSGNHSWPQLYNFGLSKATGKWAIYLGDGDDTIFAKGCISHAWRMLEKQNDDVAGGIFFYKNTHPADPEWDSYGVDFTYGNKLLMNYGLVRLDCFKDVGGLDETYTSPCANIDFCYKLYEKGKQFIPLPQSFVAYDNLPNTDKKADYSTDIKSLLQRWRHFIPPDAPEPKRLLWQEDIFPAFHLLNDLEQLDSGIEDFWHGLASLQQGFFSIAKEKFNQVTKSQCNHWLVWWYLAKAAYDCHDIELAKKSAQTVLKFKPDFIEAKNFLTRLACKIELQPQMTVSRGA